MPSEGSRQSVLHYLRHLGRPASAAGIGDAELLRRFAFGRDEIAFELLVWRHGAMVLRVCRGVLRDHAAAEDAFQATFLALARSAASVARRTSPVAWLYRVAYRIALNARTADARRSAREAQATPRPESSAVDTVVAAAELAALLHEEVNRLAHRYRKPVILCYLEGKTHEDAARELGWPKGTVSGRLARARDILRRRSLRRGVTLPAAGLAVAFAETADAAVTVSLTQTTARAAVAYLADSSAATAPSAAGLRMADEVIRTMFLTKVKAGVFVGLAALIVAASVGAFSITESAVRAQPGPEPAAAPGAGEPVVERSDAGAAAAMDASIARQHSASAGNLRKISWTVTEYESGVGYFPRNITDKRGAPLLSWRVVLLPFLDQAELYNQFKLDEPWDGPNN
jgi:RNA polymerase sigma factor (sigma-70 family)